MIIIQPPNDALDMDNEYDSVYQTMYAMPYVEREDNDVYTAEELLLEVV